MAWTLNGKTGGQRPRLCLGSTGVHTPDGNYTVVKGSTIGHEPLGMIEKLDLPSSFDSALRVLNPGGACLAMRVATFGWIGRWFVCAWAA